MRFVFEINIGDSATNGDYVAKIMDIEKDNLYPRLIPGMWVNIYNAEGSRIGEWRVEKGRHD